MMDKFKKEAFKVGANPVDLFNTPVEGVAEYICRGSKLYEPAPDSRDICTKDGKEAFSYVNGAYTCETGNLGFEKGARYTPFQLLTAIRFRGSYRAAIQMIELDFMRRDVPYIRVGVNYFKKIQKVNPWGVTTTELKVWNKDTIKDDFGSGFLELCHQFDDFTIEPDNRNYQEVVGGMWNLYEPFPHKPHPDPVSIEEIPTTAYFMAHIFGEQVDLGYQYMKVLYERPKQILPVLVLVSKERQTGKTSFLNWLDIIFANNFTVVAPEDLNSAFNSQYAYKNIIGIDEAVIDRKSAVEKIKSIATAKTILVNQKMIAQYRIPFYGKIVITTNREKDFMRIDSEEIRFWVRKLDSIPSDKMTEDFYDRLKAEVPKFLRYLIDSIDVEYGRSRMVFTYEEIQNEFLEEVKKDSRSGLHKDLELHIREWFIANPTETELYARLKDIKDHWFQYNANVTPSYIKKVLTDEMGYETQPYNRYRMMGAGETYPGAPYRFVREDFVTEELEEPDQYNPFSF